MTTHNAPFNQGDIVTQIGNEHFGQLRVVDCRWVANTVPGVEAYWRVTTVPAKPQEFIYSINEAAADAYRRVEE